MSQISVKCLCFRLPSTVSFLVTELPRWCADSQGGLSFGVRRRPGDEENVCKTARSCSPCVCYELRRSSLVSWAIGSSTVGLACCNSFRMVLLCSIPNPLVLFDRTVVKLPTAKLESHL